MLPSDCPTSLNFLLPFLQRATEMSEAQPVLAYYCKYYAVLLALKGGPNKFQRSPESDTFLAKLFDDLEAEKSKLSYHSTIKDLTQGAIYVRELAYRIFLSAEKQESSTETLKKALQSYLAALNFLQVYRGIFLEDPAALDLGEEERSEELVQVDEKSKFAKWRVIEIKKQLLLIVKQSSSAVNQSYSSDYKRNSSDYKSNSPVNTTYSPLNNTYSPTTTLSPIITSHPHLLGHHPTTQLNAQVSSPPALMIDIKRLSECERLARHAISALNFDDVETAADNLRAALKVLQPFLKQQ